MLDQMGEAILAGLLVLGAGPETDVDMDDGGFAINVEEKVEAIGEGGALDGEPGLSVSEQGEEQGEGAAAEHSGHLIA
jgi:hypothetical protein